MYYLETSGFGDDPRSELGVLAPDALCGLLSLT